MENNKNMASNQENSQENVVTLKITEAQQMFMLLSQIPVRGKQDAFNMCYVLDVLEKALSNQ